MKIHNIIGEEELCKYDHIVAWGLGPLFETNYLNCQRTIFTIDAVIDGRSEHLGEVISGISVVPPDYLNELEGRTLVVCYTIYETEVWTQMCSMVLPELDFILYAMIRVGQNLNTLPHCAKNGEDVALLNMLNRLDIDSVRFLEIGVCHPIIRNNTYLLYEKFSKSKGYKGVVVEPNPLMHDLIEEYRPADVLIKKGVTGSHLDDPLEFYMFPNLLGHSTFVKELADNEGLPYEVMKIPTTTINEIIEDHFEGDLLPIILALDAEGMDYDILSGLDFRRFQIPVIITEIIEEYKDNIFRLFSDNGYILELTTEENTIWRLGI
ncbi:Methyltransferase FkbM domain-containing protein [Lachnospiraceae bacterium XBB2008]|nr:Methyltransferase FkbM domain-containing protein [Lachnospiraceae bacterium XBB2008]